MNNELKQQLESQTGKILRNWLGDWYKETESILKVREFADDKAQALEFKTALRVHQEIGLKLQEITDLIVQKAPAENLEERIAKTKKKYGIL